MGAEQSGPGVGGVNIWQEWRVRCPDPQAGTGVKDRAGDKWDGWWGGEGVGRNDAEERARPSFYSTAAGWSGRAGTVRGGAKWDTH